MQLHINLLACVKVRTYQVTQKPSNFVFVSHHVKVEHRIHFARLLSPIRYSSSHRVCVLVSSHRLDLLPAGIHRVQPKSIRETPRVHASQEALTFPVLFGSPPPFRYVNMTSTSPVSAARNIFNSPTLGKEGDREPRFPAPWELSLREIADGHRTGTFAEGANIITQLCSNRVGSSGV